MDTSCSGYASGTMLRLERNGTWGVDAHWVHAETRLAGKYGVGGCGSGGGGAWMLGQAGMMFLFGMRATVAAGAWQWVKGLR